MKFTAEIQKVPNINGAFVEMPFDVEKEFGAKRVKVKATFDGVAYRGSIVYMGGCFMLGLTQAIRTQIGKKPGDMIEVTVEKDTEERTVVLPEDAKQAFEAADVMDAWNKQSFSKQRDYSLSLENAKKQETRERRIAKIIDTLKG